MSLKEKYFEKEGYTAFRLWAFAVAVEELSSKANCSKAASLRDQVIEFSESAWVSARSTAEERKDIQKLIDNLTVMAVN